MPLLSYTRVFTLDGGAAMARRDHGLPTEVARSLFGLRAMNGASGVENGRTVALDNYTKTTIGYVVIPKLAVGAQLRGSSRRAS